MNVEEIRKKVRSLCENAGLQFFFAVPNASEWAVTDCEHLRKIVSYHKELETLPPVTSTQRWIPVTEDVPPIETICLWCNKHGSVFTSEITYRSECNSYVGKHGYFSNGLQNYGDIVAWMPLPEPYKEGKEE